jgi:hypothetical protein
MRCIHCGSNSQLRDRPSQTCPKCGRRFAFEPTADPFKVTDGFFEHACVAVSGGGRLHFTERQLWHEFNRRLARRGRWWMTALGFAALSLLPTVCLVSNQVSWGLVLPVVGGVAGAVFHLLRQRTRLRNPPVSFERFQTSYLNPWISAHGPIALLIPSRPPVFGKPSAPEPDLAAYSFDRALVVDCMPLAAMLVANNFHFENNCAILSADGFPPGRASTILSMLRANPQLTVYALHDASPNGCRLPLVLRQPEWFPERSIFVFDLGLLPRHVKGQRWPNQSTTPQTLSPEQTQRLLPSEVEWLMAGNVAELAYLRPAALIRSVYRGIGRSAEAIEREREGKGRKDDSGDGGGSDNGDVIIMHDYHSGPYQAAGNGEDGDPEAGDLSGDDFDNGVDGGDGDDGGDAGADSFG